MEFVLIVALSAFGETPDATSDLLGVRSEFTWVAQIERKCVIHDFSDSTEKWLGGEAVRFGRSLELNCFFGVNTFQEGRLKAIDAGGMVENPTGRTMYHGFHIAFFDEQENLVACAGGVIPGSQTRPSVSRLMPIPKGVHRRIASYKVAYYESEHCIGRTRREKNIRETYISNGVTEERIVPSSKSDGESRGTPFQIHVGSRLLPTATPSDWQSETKEGVCSLRRDPPLALQNAQGPASPLREGAPFSTTIGENLELKVDCFCRVDRNNAIEPWVSFKNASEKKMFGTLYLAFFDKLGNLVGSTDFETSTEPLGSSPSGFITPRGGRSQPIDFVFQGAPPMPIPLGFEQDVAFYKMTLYVSEKPIGENEAGVK